MAFGVLLGGRELLVFLVQVPSFWLVICLCHCMLCLCELTLRIVTICLGELMVAMMWAISSLCGWLSYEEGCLTWFSRRYMLLRLFVKINVSMLRT